MYYENFSSGTNQVLNLAKLLADKYGCKYIGSEHILFGLLNAEECKSSSILKDAGVTNERFLTFFQQNLDKTTVIPGNMLTAKTKNILERAYDISKKAQAVTVCTEHLLLAVLYDTECFAVTILLKMEIDVDGIIKTLASVIFDIDEENESSGDLLQEEGNGEDKLNGIKSVTTPYIKSAGSGQINDLEKFAINLNKKAEDGKLDPVIGRKKEIDRLIQILSRRTKNNPVLIGEPGVGKSAVIEGLAQAIVSGNVPELLANKVIFSLDLAGMLAGTRYRGDFEDRLKKAIEVVKSNGNIILFIDEIHNIVGAGSTGDDSMDVANILKPMLSRGELQTMGATTIDEYRKYIEKDPALERRFQPIMVEAPTTEQSVEILKGLRDKYESHHGVTIPDDAIETAVNLSDRYITDRFLPDKAIDLIDEASSRVRLDSYNFPAESMKKEKELNRLISEMEEAIRRGDMDKELKFKREIDRVKREIQELKTANERNVGIREKLKITPEDISKVVSDWTGIPIQKITETEAHKLLGLENALHQRVVGQSNAVKAVAYAIRRARAGLKDPNRPIGSFIFVGPTGVGKTELTKALAQVVFGSDDNLIRIDMSEYMEKNSVSKLVGAPPGYVGYDEEGQLTEKVRRKPYSVVLFDEIEKAHPDVFNILLQLLDDGRLTDSKGRLVSFKNAIIIMTSNVGATEISHRGTLGFLDSREKEYDDTCDKYNEALKQKFRPEFLNRIDDIIVFHKLNKEETAEIAGLLLNKLRDRLEVLDIDLEVTDTAMDLITELGYNSEYGARPLKRVIEHRIEDKLSEEILTGRLAHNSVVTVDARGEEFIFRNK